MTLADLLAAIATLAILCCSFVVRPTHARCPWDLDLRTGVRPDGRFTCWPHPSGPRGVEDWDGTWERPERSHQPSWRLGGRVFCTGGSRPIVVDYQTVGCQREAP